MEDNVYICCRKKDICIIASLIMLCKNLYKESTVKHMNLYIDKCSWLPDDSLGVELATFDRKVVLRNTLESRIDQIMLKSVPAISTILFDNKLHTLKL